MKRRNFIKAVTGAVVMTQIPAGLKAQEKKCAEADEAAEALPLRQITKITIPVGASKPFSALHLSDSHFTRTDERDNERKRKLSAKRLKIFPKAEQYFEGALQYAKKKDMLILHTGDMIDFVSEANLEYVKSRLQGVDFFVAAGSHEYSQYVGEAKEDEAYKAQTFDMVQSAYPNDLRFASRVINGVNFVAIDDVYYYFAKEHKELMKKEIQKGLPIVMMCHVPLYTPEYYKINMHSNKNRCAYLTGAPLECTETYECDPERPVDEQWRNRSIQQRSDKDTLEFIKWLKKQKLIKAILCGHTHGFYQGTFSPTAMQHVAGSNYNGNATEILFI